MTQEMQTSPTTTTITMTTLTSTTTTTTTTFHRRADGKGSPNHARSYDDDNDHGTRYQDKPDRRCDRVRGRKRKSRAFDVIDSRDYHQQSRDWQPHRPKTEQLSVQDQLTGPCTFHFYYDDNGKRKSTHMLKDCRKFMDLQEAYVQVQKSAVDQGYATVPGQTVFNAPLSTPPVPVVQQQRLQTPSVGPSTRVEPYIWPTGQLNMVHRVVRERDPPALKPYPKPRGSICMIQKGRVTNRKQKLISRQVNLAVTTPPATPEYLNWSEQDVSFMRGDHPPQVPRPGHAALVLEAQIGRFEMSKVFMDGGSGINLIFANTLRAMNLSLSNLAASDTSFHSIVPGKPEIPLGKIGLDVIFGTPENYRRERIEFEVVDWSSQYHAILG